MDTRTKIVSTEEAKRITAKGATVVAGAFDPLLAGHAEQLRELKRGNVPLVVVIAEVENPILPARARAELVAGLAVVDHVVEAGHGLTENFCLVDDHEQMLEDLIEHVHARQGAAS